MPGQFLSPEGDLENIFIDDHSIIDQYAATGSLWLMGRNQYGQLGDNTTADKSSPVQTISGGTNWMSVAGGGYHTAAIKTDGTLWTWGLNNNLSSKGALGDNTTVNKSSPVQTVSGGTDWKSVSCGLYHTASIKTNGALWLWGTNANAQLGDNTTTNQSSPVQTVSGGTNWKSISCGNYHTAAIKTDGTLWLWGTNGNGQLGDNSTTNRSSPVQTVSAGTNWKSVACGGYMTAAIKTDGTLWLWGKNNYGQLGANNTTGRSSPVQTVSAGTNWKLVSSGGYHNMAIKTDGTLWTWGYNGNGYLGNNTTNGYSSPIQTIAAGTNWKSVSGVYNTAAIKTDGTLWNCGYGGFGQLGTNSTLDRSSPVQTVSGGTNWKLVSSGHYHTAAIHFYDASNLLYPNS